MEVGTTASGYTLTRIVGRGSRAVVWEATEVETGKRVALKILDTLAEQAPERLRAEFVAQGRVQHGNVVQVFDLIEIDGNLTLVQELVDGPDLRAYIDEGRPDRLAAVRVFAAIMRGLAAAHEQGLVHRDLKPTNILMTVGPYAKPKITDFGIVKAHDSMEITQSGMVLGTLRYMSPEQLQDPSGVDHRTDLFAAGCILYELLTHKRLFEGPNKVALMNAVRMGKHEPFPDDMDPDLRTLIEELIAPDRENRPSSAHEVIDRLGMSLDPSVDLTVPIPTDQGSAGPSWGFVALALGVILIAGLVVGLGIAAFFAS